MVYFSLWKRLPDRHIINISISQLSCEMYNFPLHNKLDKLSCLYIFNSVYRYVYIYKILNNLRTKHFSPNSSAFSSMCFKAIASYALNESTLYSPSASISHVRPAQIYNILSVKYNIFNGEYKVS